MTSFSSKAGDPVHSPHIYLCSQGHIMSPHRTSQSGRAIHMTHLLGIELDTTTLTTRLPDDKLHHLTSTLQAWGGQETVNPIADRGSTACLCRYSVRKSIPVQHDRGLQHCLCTTKSTSTGSSGLTSIGRGHLPACGMVDAFCYQHSRHLWVMGL